jgi:hypothetical protein
VYSQTLDEHYVPYVFPVENGGKQDVKWLTITDPSGVGLRVESVEGDAPLHMSVLPMRFANALVFSSKPNASTTLARICSAPTLTFPLGFL